jgi:hypothetical protein
MLTLRESTFSPLNERPSFQSIWNNWQNYILVYFNVDVCKTCKLGWKNCSCDWRQLTRSAISIPLQIHNPRVVNIQLMTLSESGIYTAETTFLPSKHILIRYKRTLYVLMYPNIRNCYEYTRFIKTNVSTFQPPSGICRIRYSLFILSNTVLYYHNAYPKGFQQFSHFQCDSIIKT